MKRTMMIAAVIGMALLIAAPASALETKFSGELRMQGFSHDNVNLEKDSSTASYYRSRFRLKTTFEITENISVTGQFDALDRYWGKSDDQVLDPSTLSMKNVDSDDNIDWDTAYATIKTKVGGFLVGRQWNSQWGCFGIGDSTGPVDRILYLLPIENLTFVAYAQKYGEYDEGSDFSDADNDKYVALARYQGQDIEAGLLTAFYNFKQFPAMRDMISFRSNLSTYSDAATSANASEITYNTAYNAALVSATQQAIAEAYSMVPPGSPPEVYQAAAESASIAARDAVDAARFVPNTDINDALNANGLPGLDTAYASYASDRLSLASAASAASKGLYYADSARAYIVDPYFVAKFDGFTLKGEFIYGWGKAEFDPGRTALDGNPYKDLDVDVMTYLFEAGYETGPFAMRGGYWYMSGDNDTSDDTFESFAYIEPNRDLDIAFLLTGDNDHYTSDLTNSLGGGIGNFSGNAQDPLGAEYGGALALAGAKMFYLGFDYKPIDTVTLGLTWANAKADKPPGPQIYSNVAQEWDDEVGDEYDFKVVWKPWPNLEYKFIAAYLDAGDFWKQGGTKEIDDLTTFYNALTISF